MAIDECRALQSRANISLACSGKTSEDGLMFWIRFGGSGLRGVGGSDLYAFGLPVLLYQRSVNEDIFIIVRSSLWVYGWTNSSTPPNGHPFAEYIDFLTMELENT